MLHRRNLLALPICLMWAPLENVWAQQSKSEAPSMRVAVGGKAFLQYAPLTIAKRLGYFKEAGVDIEIVDVAGGARALEALVGGSAEVTAGAFDHTIQMQAKNQEIVGIVLFGRHPTFALAVRSEKASAYRDARDLKGMKVGVTALGSQTQFMIEYLAIRAGLAPSEISFVSVGGGAGAIAAIRHGAVDAVVTGEPALTTLVSAGDVKIVADTRTSAGTIGLFGGLYPSGTMYARADFIARNPQTIQAFANAMVRALIWIDQATAENIADVLPAEWAGSDRELFLASIRGTRDMFSPDGKFSLDEAEVAFHVLSTVDPSLRGAKIDLEATFTNAFVDKAHAILVQK
ncbi:ABC transporter substrate-binding protein [Bradyrhizobium sp.]|uniref:ABC transporter substrate-binding protein n=1 Tax=Bradyrhizobium sp. TaxID=376 RepID=UPI003C6F38B5